MNKFSLSLLLLTCATLSSLTACGSGGGGGDDDFVGAANVSIEARPSHIDSGDRTKVMIGINEVHQNGIALKVRFPDGLRYVTESASLNAADRNIIVEPTVNASSKEGGDVYLVFYLSQSLFRLAGEEYRGEAGTLSLQLEGRSTVKDGKIQVDADVDDPAEDNSVEFDINNPEFAAEDQSTINVVD